MCGIFAYLNFDVRRERRYILELLFNGLRRLEYRGYDPQGYLLILRLVWIATPSLPLWSSAKKATSSHLSNLSTKGKLGNEKGSELTKIDGMVLKETLVRQGFSFESETDTVIPKLAKFIFDNTKEEVDKLAKSSEAPRLPSAQVIYQQTQAQFLELAWGGNGLQLQFLKWVSWEVLSLTIQQDLGCWKHCVEKLPIFWPPGEFPVTRLVFSFPTFGQVYVAFIHIGSPGSTQVFPRECDKSVTFSQIVLEVMRHLEGAYALIFKSRHYPNELIACKRGSPLLLGVKDGRASIFKFDRAKGEHAGALARPDSVQRALSILEMEVEQINKGKYEHYMQKEIHEQPESLTTTMRGRLIRGGSCKSKSVLLGGIKDHLKTIRRSRRIVFIGCGTSYNAALAARPILEELSGIPVSVEIASDLLDRQGPIYREDTAIFVSQSGETADTLQALEYALENGALCVGITNTVGSAIARHTHCGVHINAGCEIGVASTKAYTSQIVVMAMLALAIGDDTLSSQARREAIIDGLFDLPSKVKDVLKLDQEMKNLAQLLIAEQSLLVFGRGYNYATALEGALKVKEVALMHSEGILAGEMKHGPLALVDETLPIVVVATRDACFSKQQSVIQQLHARKGRLIVMCTKGDAASVCVGGSCRVIEVPQVEDCLQPVINIVPLQLLAYHLTVLRGYNVDQPRNLAKSVTTQ
ncbi:Glutamine--fructose-6-phosphate aminotransferase [isomerizing] 2 [Sesamum angolense]|uniref:Glutamine--fructose-6-phosphate aminotransferase [isomerizing] 2 n=1 Tax=Sesamum angolense TaxID=2727404 RepID=A0AAE1VYM7_9LAMI|nr:Glutamine--fructose-6-phosphate aminotransferase [isomerizing] 2 [Sesamum angolense]